MPLPRLPGLGTPRLPAGLSSSAPCQAPSITLGFRAAADLLSPAALLRFSAVAHGQDPPTGDSKEQPLTRVGLPQLLSGCGPPHALAPLPPGLSQLRRLGLVYLLYLFLFSGLEFTLSFLVHQRFQFSRWECKPSKDPTWGHPAISPCPGAQPRNLGRAVVVSPVPWLGLAEQH